MGAGYRKRIICLANSRKISGRCIAGKEIEEQAFGQWVRPISDRENGELSEFDRRYENGADPKLLDIISIPMKKPYPHGFQMENHLIDEDYYWVKEGQMTVGDLAGLIDVVHGPLWDNASSSYNGHHDRVSEHVANGLGYSLRLIGVDDLEISVGLEGAEFGNGKRRVRGGFSLNGWSYSLSITDPTVERQYLAGPNNSFNIGAATLCVSLGEPYQGYAYKLIAGVFL